MKSGYFNSGRIFTNYICAFRSVKASHSFTVNDLKNDPTKNTHPSPWSILFAETWQDGGAIYNLGVSLNGMEIMVCFFVGNSHPQRTSSGKLMLVQCWPTVCDAGPTLNQHWFNASCLLGYFLRRWDQYQRYHTQIHPIFCYHFTTDQLITLALFSANLL